MYGTGFPHLLTRLYIYIQASFRLKHFLFRTAHPVVWTSCYTIKLQSDCVCVRLAGLASPGVEFERFNVELDVTIDGHSGVTVCRQVKYSKTVHHQTYVTVTWYNRRHVTSDSRRRSVTEYNCGDNTQRRTAIIQAVTVVEFNEFRRAPPSRLWLHGLVVTAKKLFYIEPD